MPRPGPAPKHPSMRARQNKDAHPVTTIKFVKGEQPELPEDAIPFPWPDITRDWWAAWGASPLADEMMEIDWYYLLDGAVLHADIWTTHNLDQIPVLHKIEKDMGATLSERLKLRIQAEEANKAEAEGKKRREASPAPTKKNDPRKGLRAV